MKKRINKEIIIMAIISILFLMMSIVYADYLYNSNQVSFNNSNTTLTSTDVQSAIDELYNKCSNVPEIGTCPEGYECTPLTRVTYNANGGTFTGDNTTNDVYYSVVEGDPIEKISKTSNVDDEGNKIGYMPKSTGTTDTVTIEGADSLEVTITYQTYSSSYSYVYVRDKNGTNVSSKLYGTTKTTTTVTVTGDTVKFYFYNSQSQSSSYYSNYYGYYAKIKGKKNDKYIAPLEVTKEEGDYGEPTKTDHTFVGWTLNQDGSGQVYANEQKVMDSLDTESRSVVLYAKWFEGTPTCKRAITLHTETCNSDTSTTSQYCRGDGYYASGSKGTTTITYGSLGTVGQEPSSGDAFDCDVTGNGDWERFYYVSNYYDTSSKTFDNDYYVFIYYSSTSGGVISTENTSWYSGSTTSGGPITAITALPTTSQWRDDLLKTSTRNILRYDTDINIVTSFSYLGKAARLLTFQEFRSACPNSSGSTGSLSGCNYLFERTKYSTSSYSADGLWLETTYSSNSAWELSSFSRSSGQGNVTYASYGVRPVIEIPKTDVSY